MHWHAPDDLTLQRYLDGSLATTEQAAFANHLVSCPTCQEELQCARRLEQLAGNWREVNPPAHLEASVRRRLQPRPALSGWLVAAAAAALIGFGIGRGLWRRTEEGPHLGLATPSTTSHPAPQLEDRPAPQPLAAQQIWTTGQAPNLVAFSGQILNLSPHTRLEVVWQQGNRSLLRLRQGEVRVQEHGGVIAVETDLVRVEPLGTDYLVSCERERTRVYLFSGKVRVTTPESQVTLSSPGQSTQFPLPRVEPRPTFSPQRPAAPIPGPPYPQRTPLPHSQTLHPLPPQWTRPEPWKPRPGLEHRPPGGPPIPPWERVQQPGR
ncbi:MAG: FecR domain-containing protein [Vulcanimicrobiota bacterium]